MNLISFIFDHLLKIPIENVLFIIYKALDTAHIPGALGLSIILLTIIIRIAVAPLTASQLKSSKKMAELKPHLERIKTKHGHDKVRHQEEISRLYKEHGVNPLAGCLPLLLQIPVFIALYRVLDSIVKISKPEELTALNERLYSGFYKLSEVPSPNFLGFNLSSKPNEWATVGIFVLTIPILTGVLQYIQSKMLVAQATEAKKEKKVKKEKESLEDSMAQMQSQMALIMPAMIAFFSYGFPVGLSLYWNVFTIAGIVQQYKIMGAGSLNKYLPEKWRK